MPAAPSIERFVELCLAQKGDKYVFGAEAPPTDPNPEAFDCSELTEWAARRLEVPFVDGSMNQREFCRARGKLISVSEGLRTRGALLFRDISVTGVGHVAVSLGTKSPAPPLTIEARGSAYGVGVFDARPESRLWTEAARLPGFDYTREPEPPKMIDRYVVFGRYGGRIGHVNADRLEAKDPQAVGRLLRLIEEADRRHRQSVLVHRREPKRLEEFGEPEYPAWVAAKAARK